MPSQQFRDNLKIFKVKVQGAFEQKLADKNEYNLIDSTGNCPDYPTYTFSNGNKQIGRIEIDSHYSEHSPTGKVQISIIPNSPYRSKAIKATTIVINGDYDIAGKLDKVLYKVGELKRKIDVYLFMKERDEKEIDDLRQRRYDLLRVLVPHHNFHETSIPGTFYESKVGLKIMFVGDEIYKIELSGDARKLQDLLPKLYAAKTEKISALEV